MIDLFKKILSLFGFQSTKPNMSLVEETVKFLNTIPKGDLKDDNFASLSGYVGDINYLEDKDGRTYYQDLRSKTYYCDYDVKNPSKEVLGLMIDETTFTAEQLKEKLKND